jgi:transposase
MVTKWRIIMNKKYIVRLKKSERDELVNFVKAGKAAAHKIKHANILLKADAESSGWADEQIADAFGCCRQTVENIRKRFVEQSLMAALERKKRILPPREKIIDGKAEAHVIALACSDAPKGRVRWTLELLADKLVELNVVETVSYRTVQRTLKKTGCSLTGKRAG